MDAIEAVEPRRSLPSPPTDRVVADVDLHAVERLVWQLPVLIAGRWTPGTPLGNADAALRLQAALWELAARRHIAVGPDATVAEVASLLASRRAVAPAAAKAATMLASALAVDGFDRAACRLAGRLVAHLELRARYG